MRPDWDHYFMEITEVVAKRSTCLRRQVGAVIAKDKHIFGKRLQWGTFWLGSLC